MASPTSIAAPIACSIVAAGVVASSDYREFRPSGALSRHLICTWVEEIGAGDRPFTQRVLPDGCIDLVYMDGDLTVAGPATGVIDVSMTPASTAVGVRIRPGLAHRVLDARAAEVRDRSVRLADLWGTSADAIVERLQDEATAAGQIAILEDAVLGQAASLTGEDETFASAAAWLAGNSDARLPAARGPVDLTSRYARRQFDTVVGYGPKFFQRVMRFQRLLDLAARPHVRLVELALDAGYADQAHMTREVQALAGQTPTAVLGSASTTLSLSEMFNTAPPPGA